MKNSFLKIRINDDEYQKFQETCENKGKNMSEVMRAFIKVYNNGKNIILLDIDNETFDGSLNLCKEKKIKLNDVVKYLLNKAIKNKDKLNFK